jgi:hypothetical protein
VPSSGCNFKRAFRPLLAFDIHEVFGTEGLRNFARFRGFDR